MSLRAAWGDGRAGLLSDFIDSSTWHICAESYCVLGAATGARNTAESKARSVPQECPFQLEVGEANQSVGGYVFVDTDERDLISTRWVGVPSIEK